MIKILVKGCGSLRAMATWSLKMSSSSSEDDLPQISVRSKAQGRKVSSPLISSVMPFRDKVKRKCEGEGAPPLLVDAARDRIKRKREEALVSTL